MSVYFIFMDESGYTFDWESDIAKQPFYVVSGVCIPVNNLPDLYSSIREEVGKIDPGSEPQPLGLGYEIKARDIARGSGLWSEHNEERNSIRDLFLSAPEKADGSVFVAIIDKKKHQSKYSTPADPYYLAMTFVLERVNLYLSQTGNFGYCIYDQNKKIEPEISDNSAYLIREGSQLIYHSKAYDELVIKKNKLHHILELSFGISENSIGLQLADFFSTLTYHYFCAGKPDTCGWWDTLESNLHRKDGVLDGVGLKVFP